MACRYSARKSGEIDLASVLKQVQENPAKIRKLLDKPEIVKLTSADALSYVLDHSVSKDNYISLRLLTKRQGADIFPAYEKVRDAKMMCRPSKELLSVTDNKAEVSLQSLLNHTANRIVDLQKDVITHYFETSNSKDVELILICSWGFDGSSGHSSYKQNYANTSAVDVNVDDETLLATTCIPQRLATASNVIIWNNRTPQSPRFCRPIKLEFVHESKDVIMREKEYMDNQIDNLQIFEVIMNNYKIRIHFSLYLTLIDGKVLTYITNTKSMQTCPICHATPKEFNSLSKNNDIDIFLPDPKSLQYGISPLHSRIRFLECCLHISYRLPVKAWQIRTQFQKSEYARRKREIQQILWDKLGLKVDKPKSGGSGSSNDGNTARRAFENPELLSEYLGLDQQMLTNFKIILIALNCQFPLNPTLFQELCLSTATIYIDKYAWYPMPSTIHKILVHGADIIRTSILPVGVLGEEAAESRNKHYKSYRLHHSRKCSRSATLEDVFNRAMDTSDPVISTISLQTRMQKRYKLPLPPEVQSLLAQDMNSCNHQFSYFDEDEDIDETSLVEDIELSDEEPSHDDE